MKSILLLVLIITGTYATQARPIKVMSFNTTCSFCGKKKFDKFKIRKHWIVDTIKRSDPDLISLQEIMFGFQLNWLADQLPNYHVVTKKIPPIGKYPDSTLLIKKRYFSLLDSDGFWLSPKSKSYIGFGWKAGFPRHIVISKIRDNVTGEHFIFAGSHFDNNTTNKNNSAKLVSDFFQRQSLPIIFAADTNLNPSRSGYKTLNEYLEDTFDIKNNFEIFSNSSIDASDSCNLSKGITFPECRVDHIFISRSAAWLVENWVVDQYKYGKSRKFVSDHRAVMATIEID